MISRSHGNSCRPGNRTYGRSLSQNPGRRSVPVRIGAIRGAAGRCVRFRAGRMPRFSVPCGCRSVRSCAGESFMRSDMRLSAAVRRGRFGRQKASSACFHRGGGGTLSAVVRFRISFRARVSGPNSEHAPRNFEKFTGNWKIRKRRIAYCRIFVTFALPIPVFSTYGMPGWRNR